MTIIYRPIYHYLTLFVSALILAFGGLSGFNHNDHMYAVAPHLQGTLYQDINFVQAPLSYYFLKSLVVLSPEGHTYVALRVSTIVVIFFSIVISSYIIPQNWMKILFVLAASTNLYTIHISYQIGSYALPLFLLSLSVIILLRSNSGLYSAFLPALFVGLAASAKLNHLLFFFVFITIITFQIYKNGIRSSLPLGLAIFSGGMLGLIPILYFFSLNQDAFLLHNIVFHSDLSNAFRNLDIIGSALNVASGVLDWITNLSGIIYLLCIFILVYLVLNRNPDVHKIIALAYLGVSFLVAIVPLVIFESYLVPSTFLSLIFISWSMHYLSNERIKCGVVVVLLLSIIVSVFNWAPRAAFELWSHRGVMDVVEMNRAAKKIIGAISYQGGCDPTVYTLSGAFVVDSGFAISDPMVTGIFWPRLRNVIHQKYFEDQKWSLKRDIVFPENMIKDNKVNFVITGYYHDHFVEEDIIYELEQKAYKDISLGEFRGRLLTIYVHPDCYPGALSENIGTGAGVDN